MGGDKGLRGMIEVLGAAVGRSLEFPPERLLDYGLLKESQKYLGSQ
jgi:hypothetical protein